MRRMVIVCALGIVLGVVLWKTRHGGRSPAPAAPAETTAVHAPRPGLPRRLASRAAPRLVAPSSGGQIANDQFSPGYDAVKLTQATSSSLATIFYGEVRDPQWAPQREAAIKPIVQRDLKAAGLDAELVKTECRHSTCELTFTGSDRDQVRQANRAMQYALLGAVYEPGAFSSQDGRATFTARVAFDEQERDPDAWDRGYQQRRRDRLALLRREGVPDGYPPLPPE
jgi:hypothetical protein